MQSNTIVRRLSAAVLAGCLLLTAGAAGATAANAAPAAKADQQQDKTQANAYELAQQLFKAKTAGDAVALLAAAKQQNVPGAAEGVETLSSVDAKTPLATTPDASIDGLVDVRAVVQRYVLNELNPASSVSCGNSALDKYVAQFLPRVDPNGTPQEQGEALGQAIALVLFATMGGLDAPTYEALYVGDTTKPLRTFGEEQNKSALVKNSFADIKKFWSGDVETGPITVSAMKDDIVTNDGKAALRKYAAYALAASSGSTTFDPRVALASTDPQVRSTLDTYGQGLHAILDQVPTLDGGEAALFTLNAYAFSPTAGVPNEVGLPKRMVFGDGMLSFLRVAKFGDPGIKSVLGHQFGHHIQYTIGFDTPEATAPEQTRHSELEADTFATYWSTHVLGGKYKVADQAKAVQVFANVGDCSTESAGHHGTPAQREAAALFGQSLAEGQKKNKHVFAAESIRLKFNKVPPTLIAAE